jgi:hypothetical protein
LEIKDGRCLWSLFNRHIGSYGGNIWQLYLSETTEIHFVYYHPMILHLKLHHFCSFKDKCFLLFFSYIPNIGNQRWRCLWSLFNRHIGSYGGNIWQLYLSETTEITWAKHVRNIPCMNLCNVCVLYRAESMWPPRWDEKYLHKVLC